MPRSCTYLHGGLDALTSVRTLVLAHIETSEGIFSPGGKYPGLQTNPGLAESIEGFPTVQHSTVGSFVCPFHYFVYPLTSAKRIHGLTRMSWVLNLQVPHDVNRCFRESLRVIVLPMFTQGQGPELDLLKMRLSFP